jgi:hypothetical protein
MANIETLYYSNSDSNIFLSGTKIARQSLICPMHQQEERKNFHSNDNENKKKMFGITNYFIFYEFIGYLAEIRTCY